MYWDAGAYADYAVNVTRASAYSAAGPYDIPNAWLDAYTIYTNKPYGTAYRGFGHVEFFWGLERHMELVAQTIGMDPLEFRRKNLSGPARDPHGENGHRAHRRSPQVPRGVAAKAINYGQLTPAEKAREARAGVDRQGGRDPAQGACDAALHRHGRHRQDELRRIVIVNVGLTEIGQGSATVARPDRRRAAQFPLERSRSTVEKDTDKDPYDWQTVPPRGSCSPAMPSSSPATICSTGVRGGRPRCCGPRPAISTTTARGSSSSTTLSAP